MALTTARVAIGVLLGALAWIGLSVLLPFLPEPARFWLAWLLFTFGPGVAVGARLTRNIDPLRRVIVLLGFGAAATPVLIDVLGRLDLLAAFPYIALALLGAGLALWEPSSGSARTSRADIAACVALILLAAGTGAIAFGHRVVTTADGLQVYGDYDSFDLSFYAAWASEASHKVPPTASYYAGHQLNAAYYPQLVLAMVHRFAGVPMLPIYFRYAWPAFLSLGALTAFALVRSLASVGVSLLATALIVIGGDFSYLAAWLLPHDTYQWDYVLWPTNFLAPTMEVLHFNTWAPSLPVFFTALYATARGLQMRARGWALASALLLAVLFQFKPFAYAILLAGLFAAALFSRGDTAGRRRFAATLGLSVLFALPFVYSIAAIAAEDRRSRFLFDYFLLPQRMLIKLDLTETFTNVANRLAPLVSLRRPLFLLLATVLFLLVGPGVRWAGVAGVWQAIRGGRAGPDASAWRLLGWSVVAGVAIPFVLVTDPYVDTLQFYEVGLYLLWIFTAVALSSFARAHQKIGRIAIVLAIAVTLPSSIHYLARKWTDDQRPPMAALSRSEMTIADYLRTSDPETTVVLHDRPQAPSLMTVVSERRVVLAWGSTYYAVGSEGRYREVNAFYASADGSPADALEMLRRYHVTHLIVDQRRDRVHPEVLARLTPLIKRPDVTLYAVSLPAEP